MQATPISSGPLCLWSSLVGQTFMGGRKGECLVTLDTFHGCCWNVGNTNQIAEFLTLAFTFRIGYMIIILQTRTISLTVKSELHKQLHRHCNSVPSL